MEIYVLIGICVFVTALIAYHYTGMDLVRKTSKRYAYAKEKYDSINFEKLNHDYTFSKRMNSKVQLEKMNLERQLILIISESSDIKESIRAGIRNNQRLIGFRAQISDGPPQAKEEDVVNLKISYSRYVRIETALISSLERAVQRKVPRYHFRFTYTSPKGRNSYQKSADVNIDTLTYLVGLVDCTDRYKQSAQYQRSLMSNSLRYDIMQRDGFRCVLCGRSAKDGVQLHVDHIIPVSKGGKTEWSNLRTLCQDCNLGKSNKYTHNGIN